MAQPSRPEENQFAGRTVADHVLEKEKGRGNIGVVYRCHHKDIPELLAALKIIPYTNLTADWEIELKKVGRLSGVPEVVQYRSHSREILDGVPYVCIFWEWIEGENLGQYTKQSPKMISLPFVEGLADGLLRLFIAMQHVGIAHDDLHEGNILIAHDPRLPDPDRPVMKVTDFGLGGSLAGASRKDDYSQLALVCANLLSEHVDPSRLDGEDRYFYDTFIEEFLRKKVLEQDTTVGDFVRSPRQLRPLLEQIRPDYQEMRRPRQPQHLGSPFDYLRCEQIGNMFELLQTLYSRHFPGYNDLMQRTNSLLTGPRGCGKTTIFRNLSLKVQLLAKNRTLDDLDEYVGIYYHCNDLFFAFPYLKNNISDKERNAIVHYFNAALLYEVLDTLVVAEDTSGEASDLAGLRSLEEFLSRWVTGYKSPPRGTSVLRHLLSLVGQHRHQFRRWLADDLPGSPPWPWLQLDFIPELCAVLHDAIPWLKRKPAYFFLDDYSLPRVSEPLQRTLHDFIFLGYPNCFFKVATESVTTFCPYDSAGKLIEETREYDVIDLGSQFLHADKEPRRVFIAEVVNSRLRNTPTVHEDYHDVAALLGDNPYSSYNDLARRIRGELVTTGTQPTKQRVYYAGFDTLVDLCSGDIAEILRIMRDILGAIGTGALSEPGKTAVPIKPELQDRAMREAGAFFLRRIGAAEKTGQAMRPIAEAFGRVANWTLRHRDSRNVSGRPPKQAFRIEIFEALSFHEAPHLAALYNDLIKYAVFIRDVRGKSVRGAVVDRLYLRRILIPTFLLTPSQRDNIGLEVCDFLTLLSDPAKFERDMTKKGPASDEQEALF